MLPFFKKHWMWMTFAGTAAVYAPVSGKAEDRQKLRNLETLAEVMGLVNKEAVEPPTPKQLTHSGIQGMLHTLDPHSNYMDESEFRFLREEQKGSFFGIGAIIQQQEQGIAIVTPIKGGPSEALGVRAGDVIKEIDGASTEGMSSNQALQKLRGEKGTIVRIKILRMGYPELLNFEIPRKEIPSNSVSQAFMFTGDVGYISIKDFGETTSDEFERAVNNLKKQGMKQLILDLRNNGGGLLDAAIGIGRQLLGPDQLIVSQKGRDGRDEIQTRTPKGAMLDPFPMVVLVNRSTASASEIVAGGVQDHDRGLVVGQTSWGKGLVQSVLTIGRSRGLALTTARYYTPSGRCIQRDYTHGLDDYYNPEDEKDAKGAKPQGPEYKTDLGRPVYGGGGITPDVSVDPGLFTPFMANLRFRYSAFFRYAVVEKEKFGVKLGQRADDAVLERFRLWLVNEKIAYSEKEWADNRESMKDQLSQEMQQVSHGLEAGAKLQLERDPVTQKALEVLPEAAKLLQKKQLTLQTKPGPVARMDFGTRGELILT
ncbi:MAG TPA: S41 family peptidase [Holophagaceae bacterium]|nr:S41 family peptidase [Holophagaceae bacterium]